MMLRELMEYEEEKSRRDDEITLVGMPDHRTLEWVPCSWCNGTGFNQKCSICQDCRGTGAELFV